MAHLHSGVKKKKKGVAESIPVVSKYRAYIPAEKDVVVNAQVVGAAARVNVMAILQDRRHQIAGAVQVAAAVGAVGHELHPNPSARPRIQIQTHNAHRKKKKRGKSRVGCYSMRSSA